MPEKIKLARTGLEPGVGTQPVLNPKFIKIVKRLYLKFFALYILLALSVFVLPEKIGEMLLVRALKPYEAVFQMSLQPGIVLHAGLVEFYAAAMRTASILFLARATFYRLKNGAN